MSNIDKPEPDDKFFQVIYRGEGKVDIASNNMTVFDLWALSNYVKMRADELYITTQTAERMKEQSGKQLVAARSMPHEPSKN